MAARAAALASGADVAAKRKMPKMQLKPVKRSGSSNGKVNAAKPKQGDPALVRKREELSKQFAELQWDLGGMAYEMASRDHYRLDVLNKQAAKLQQVDAELGQVERLLKMGETGTTGSCPSCGALQARGAVFCWQCGTEVKPPTAAKPKSAAKPKAKSKQ